VLIVLAALGAYSRSFSGPFVFDDLAAIQDGNPSIRHLWPLSAALSPPHDHGQTVGGRPVLNLSLAINDAISGTEVWSYHALNLGVHILAGWVLFGILWRAEALRNAPSRKEWGAGLMLALSASLLWTLHPLQTESVTYIIQRAESLAGLFYLLTLYSFIRGSGNEAAPAASTAWRALSVFFCLLGMGTKEIVVTAPVMVLLFDRTFVAGSFRSALRQRPGYYGFLAATWIPLALLVTGAHGRGGTAGWGGAISGWNYFLIQMPALVHYLRLAVWPAGLIFDYGPAVAPSGTAIVLSCLVLLMLAAATVVAFWRRHPLGFVGAWFFVVLAPSSSFVPVEVQPIAEHRMYLALAALAVVAALAIQACGRRAILALLAVAALCGFLTDRRNQVYRSPEALWGDTVAKRPGNARALCNFADALVAEGRIDEGLRNYEEAVRLELPRAGGAGHTVIVEILTNYGNALLGAGRVDEARASYEKALEFDPEAIKTRYNLGSVLMQQGALPAAAGQFEQVLRGDPGYAAAHNNLASVYLRQRRMDVAIREYRDCVALRPGSPTAFYNLGNALYQAGRAREAAASFEEALQLNPDFAEARNYLELARSRLTGAHP